MMKNKKKESGKPGLEIAAEAVTILRLSPFHITVSYFIGTVPFVLGFLFFVSDMSRSAYAYNRCYETSLGVAALFLWMKCWQSIYSILLLAWLKGESAPRWNFKRILKMVSTQLIIQPCGLVVIPVTMLLLLPFYCAYAFYQNVSVLGDGGIISIKEVTSRSWKQAVLWPKQSHMIIWLLNPWVLGLGIMMVFGIIRLVSFANSVSLEATSFIIFMMMIYLLFLSILPVSPLGCVVAGNVAAGLVIVPALMKTIFGIETMFSQATYYSIFNTTFLITVYGVSYMFLDIASKAAYVLRCYYGESLKSGVDLLAELRGPS